MKFSIMISKLNEPVDFDTDTLPVVSVEYATIYGFRKAINDAHSAVKREAFPKGDEGTAEWLAKVRAVAFERVNQIRTGAVPSVRGSVITPEMVAAVEHQRKLASLDPDTQAKIAALMGLTVTKKKAA